MLPFWLNESKLCPFLCVNSTASHFSCQNSNPYTVCWSPALGGVSYLYIPLRPGAEVAPYMPRNPDSKTARLSGVSLPEASNSIKLHYSFLIHKYTPPWMCFDSHQDQVHQLIQLAVTRLLFTAATWLKRKQSHHMLLESSDKSQVGLKFPLFLAVFMLSPGN